jgi:hypothetical protein
MDLHSVRGVFMLSMSYGASVSNVLIVHGAKSCCVWKWLGGGGRTCRGTQLSITRGLPGPLQMGRVNRPITTPTVFVDTRLDAWERRRALAKPGRERGSYRPRACEARRAEAEAPKPFPTTRFRNRRAEKPLSPIAFCEINDIILEDFSIVQLQICSIRTLNCVGPKLGWLVRNDLELDTPYLRSDGWSMLLPARYCRSGRWSSFGPWRCLEPWLGQRSACSPHHEIEHCSRHGIGRT